jgi:hypothetical protein
VDDRLLDEIEARAGRTSPGPWEAFIFSDRNPHDQDFIRIGGLDDSQPDMYVQHWIGGERVLVPFDDIEFIASARQDIPALVAEVRRLRDALRSGEGQ